MQKKDYCSIKERYESFIALWKSHEFETLPKLMDKEVLFWSSTVKAYATGAQHGLFGVRRFIESIPATDVLHYRICNFICHGDDNTAISTASVVFKAVDIAEDGSGKVFEFSVNHAVHWQLDHDAWMMTEIRQDVIRHRDETGKSDEAWHFEDPKGVWHDGIHLPLINGELDSPWRNYPEDENTFFTDEEKIQECFARYMFGVDTISYVHSVDCVSDDAIFVASPWGVLNKRERLLTSKFHRQKDRNGVHPFLVESIDINGDLAECRFFRMSGHNQRDGEYIYNASNKDMEYACARWALVFRNENGTWRIFRFNYYLGIVEVGNYEY